MLKTMPCGNRGTMFCFHSSLLVLKELQGFAEKRTVNDRNTYHCKSMAKSDPWISGALEDISALFVGNV